MKPLRFVSVITLMLIPLISMLAETPTLRHVFDIHANCANAIAVGQTPGGTRVMIPITGGSVEGEINAEIIPGGADYQMIDDLTGRVEFNAIYTLRTADSLYVNVRNVGVSTSGERGDYFTTSPTFEAPTGSSAEWLNNRIFVCRPIGFGDGVVHLRVWVVE